MKSLFSLFFLVKCRSLVGRAEGRTDVAMARPAAKPMPLLLLPPPSDAAAEKLAWSNLIFSHRVVILMNDVASILPTNSQTSHPGSEMQYTILLFSPRVIESEERERERVYDSR